MVAWVGQLLITNVGEVGADQYLDPKAEKVYTVDHMTKVCP